MAERPALHCVLQLALFLVARSTASIDHELLLPHSGASVKQPLAGTSGVPGRKLLQDSAVCGFNEYFCGEAAFISDRAYTAVSDGKCFNDTGIVLHRRT